MPRDCSLVKALPSNPSTGTVREEAPSGAVTEGMDSFHQT